jgi:hypothetical protein
MQPKCFSFHEKVFASILTALLITLVCPVIVSFAAEPATAPKSAAKAPAVGTTAKSPAAGTKVVSPVNSKAILQVAQTCPALETPDHKYCCPASTTPTDAATCMIAPPSLDAQNSAVFLVAACPLAKTTSSGACCLGDTMPQADGLCASPNLTSAQGCPLIQVQSVQAAQNGTFGYKDSSPQEQGAGTLACCPAGQAQSWLGGCYALNTSPPSPNQVGISPCPANYVQWSTGNGWACFGPPVGCPSGSNVNTGSVGSPITLGVGLDEIFGATPVTSTAGPYSSCYATSNGQDVDVAPLCSPGAKVFAAGATTVNGQDYYTLYACVIQPMPACPSFAPYNSKYRLCVPVVGKTPIASSLLRSCPSGQQRNVSGQCVVKLSLCPLDENSAPIAAQCNDAKLAGVFSPAKLPIKTPASKGPAPASK